MTKKENIVHVLRQNEYRCHLDITNKSFKRTVRCLVGSEVRQFVPKEQVKSGKNSLYQFYSLNRIVKQEEQSVVTRSGCPDKSLISDHPMLYKFLDTDVGYFAYDSKPWTRRPFMVVLTKHNFLTSLDLISGQWRESVSLGNRYKFLYLELDLDEEFIYLTSKRYSDSDLIKCVACFTASELKPVYHFEVTRSVFGDRVCDVNMNSGALVLMENGSNTTRMYDLEKILNTNEWVYEDNQTLGPTVVVTSLPPPLLVVKAAKCKLMLGARPFYVAFCTDEHSWSITRLDNFYSAKATDKNTLLASGALPVFQEDIFSELGFGFHPDSSASLLLTGHGKVRCAELITQDGHVEIRDRFTFDPYAEEAFSSDFSYSSSGRRLRRSAARRDSYSRINERPYELSWSYEDELELIAIMKSEIVEEGQRTNCVVDSITIVDAQGGDVVKKVEMDLHHTVIKRVAAETSKPQIFFDCVTLSIELPSTKHTVFRLTEIFSEEEEESEKRRVKSGSGRKQVERTRHSGRTIRPVNRLTF